MLDALLIKKLFNVGVAKFDAIVTLHFLDGQPELPLISSNKSLHFPLYFTLIIHKEHPREARIVINNNKTIFVIANANIGDWSKEIHVDELQWA
jgi:hypothetical protein